MRDALLAVLLLLATVLTFASTARNEFVLIDDDLHITHNPNLSSQHGGLRAIWAAPYQGLYIPVTYTVWAVQKKLVERYWGNWGQGPLPKSVVAPFLHATNLLLHGLNVVLAFFLLKEVVAVGWAAALGALLFAWHPVQVEPIAWISGLKDVLAGAFSLGSLLLYARYLRATPRPRGGLYLGALVCGLLAGLSKPSAVVIPAFAAVLDRLLTASPWREIARRLIPFGAVTLPLAVLTKLTQPDAHLSFVSPLWARPLIAADALTFYFSKLLVPFNLGPDYGRSPQLFLRSSWMYVVWVVPPLLFLVLRRRSLWTRSAFALFLLGILPVLGLVPFYFQEFSTVADRYLYLSLLGPALWLAWWATTHRSPRWLALYGILLACLCARAVAQVGYWRDSISLFTQNLKANPNSLISHNNLGTLLEDRNRLLDAAYHYSEVLRIDPDNLAGHYNLARIYARAGRYAKAREHFELVVARQSNLPDAQTSLGVVHLKLGDVEKARSHLFQSLTHRPNHPLTLSHLGHTFRIQGDCRRAARYYAKALERDPRQAEAHYGRGRCLAAAGKMKEAREHLERASEADPHWVAPRQALSEMKRHRGRVGRG